MTTIAQRQPKRISNWWAAALTILLVGAMVMFWVWPTYIAPPAQFHARSVAVLPADAGLTAVEAVSAFDGLDEGHTISAGEGQVVIFEGYGFTQEDATADMNEGISNFRNMVYRLTSFSGPLPSTPVLVSK